MKFFCSLFVVLAGLTGCDECKGTWCVRITNRLQRDDQPVSVQLHQQTGFIGGLYLSGVDGKELVPGESTGWFDASQGTSRSCGGSDVCYRWRVQAVDAWSEDLVCGTLEGTPSCFQEGNDYDLVVR